MSSNSKRDSNVTRSSAAPALTNGVSFIDPYVWRILSWEDTVSSAAPFAAGFALFVAHSVLDYSLPSIVAHLLFTVLFASAGLHAFKTFKGTDLLPPLSLPVSAEWFAERASAAGRAASGLVEQLNAWLSWRDWQASTRALAYAWLITRFTFLASPGYLFFCE
jgi:hypothetical protein